MAHTDEPLRALRELRYEMRRVFASISGEAPEVYDYWWPRLEFWIDKTIETVGESVEQLDTWRLNAIEDGADTRAELAQLKAQIASGELAPVPDLFSDGFDPRGAFVYMLWGKDRQVPLYVGMSVNVLARVGSHLGDKLKSLHVERVSLIACESRTAALSTESMLIQALRPQWNRAGIDPDIRHHPAA